MTVVCLLLTKLMRNGWVHLMAWFDTVRHPTIQQCLERALMLVLGMYLGADSQAAVTHTSLGSVLSNVIGVTLLAGNFFILLWYIPRIYDFCNQRVSLVLDKIFSPGRPKQ